MTRTAGAQIGCQRPSRFWGLGCPKIFHEAEDTLVACLLTTGVLYPAGAFVIALDQHVAQQRAFLHFFPEFPEVIRQQGIAFPHGPA
ncbi:hypothetical protein [Thiolapillus sp.]|nr:hypothetical protein [Thiolapillus sp.]